MNSEDFNKLQIKIQDLYQRGEYTSALELITERYESFQQYKPVLDYWKATLFASIGEIDQAFTILQESLSTGFWFSDALLKENPALKALQSKGEYKQLIQQNQELRESDPALAFPTITLRPEGKCMEGEPTCPLLLTLHANASSAQEALRFWQPAAAFGWLVAAPQSTQAIWKDAYIWEDISKAFNQIQQQFEALQKQYGIDKNRIVIAGHAKGAEIAIQLALSGEIRTCGFIAFEPANISIEDIREWMYEEIADMPIELRAVFYISQDSDPDRWNYFQRIAEFFAEMGIICQVETYTSEEGKIKFDDDASLSDVLAFLCK
jgi:predicted esterase